jgi:hypothetical protein
MEPDNDGNPSGGIDGGGLILQEKFLLAFGEIGED